MTSKLKRLIIPALILIGLMAPWAPPAIVSADIQGSLCGAATTLSVDASPNTNCQDATKGSESHFQKVLASVINIFSIIVGVVAVIMIIFAGFKYITGGGNQESVKTAKQALIYAVVGLVIVALSQVIVKFVLNQATNPSSGATAGQTCNPADPDPSGYICKCTHDESGTTCVLVKR